MDEILILGSNGLLGKKVYEYLISKNKKVIGIDKQIEGREKNYEFDITKLKKQPQLIWIYWLTMTTTCDG